MRIYQEHHDVAVGFVARQDGKQVGAIRLAPAEGGGLRVGHIEVAKDARRQRVGTRLYERAAQLSCKVYRGPLRSDVYRTAEAQAFWDKQVAKGRAVCARQSSEHEAEYAKGWPHDMSISNRGGCVHYVLRCPTRSLAGQ
jgi:GNAT superfamily N-acetyltransferase